MSDKAIVESEEYGVSLVVYDYMEADRFEDFLNEDVFVPFTVRKPAEYVTSTSGAEFFFGVLADRGRLQRLIQQFEA